MDIILPMFTVKISREGSASAPSSTKAGAALLAKRQTLTLDGQIYAMSDLPHFARDTLISFRFVEARLQQLQGELSVSRTAHVACVRALTTELDQMPGTLPAITPPP